MSILRTGKPILLVTSALSLLSCSPNEITHPGLSSSDRFVNSYDDIAQIAAGSRISFNGYFQSGHEVEGIYLDRRDYGRINTRCVSVDDMPRYNRYVNGNRYRITGTLEENICTSGDIICRNACSRYRIIIDSATSSGR